MVVYTNDIHTRHLEMPLIIFVIIWKHPEANANSKRKYPIGSRHGQKMLLWIKVNKDLPIFWIPS
jgi:hypothetical protein